MSHDEPALALRDALQAARDARIALVACSDPCTIVRLAQALSDTWPVHDLEALDLDGLVTLADLATAPGPTMIALHGPEDDASGVATFRALLALSGVKVAAVASTTQGPAAIDVRTRDPLLKKLLELLSIAPGPLPIEVACSALGIACEPEIDTSWRASELVVNGVTGLQLASGSLRETLAQRLAPDQRRRLDLALADAIVRHDKTSGRADLGLAGALLCALGQPARAAPLLVSAGRRALASRAWVRAARLFREALATGALSASESQAVQLERGRALSSASLPGPAADAFRAALHGPDTHLARDARRRAAQALLVAGRSGDGLALFDEVLAAHTIVVPRSTLALGVGIGWRRAVHALQQRIGAMPGGPVGSGERVDTLYDATLCLSLVDGVRAANLQAHHLVAAGKLGDPRRLVRALCLDRVFVASRGTAAQVRRSALEREIARGMSTCDPDPALVGIDLGTRGEAAFFEGDFGAAVALLDAAERHFIAYASDVGAELMQVRLFRLWAWAWLGAIDALRTSIDELARDAQRHGNVALQTALAVEGGAIVALADDRPDSAIAAAEAALRRSRQDPDLLPVAWFNAWAARVQAALYEGRFALAWALVDDHWAAIREARYLDVQVTRVEAWMLRGRAALGVAKLDEAARAVARLARERARYATALADFIEAGRLSLSNNEASLAHERYARAQRGFVACGLVQFAAACDAVASGAPETDADNGRARRWRRMLLGFESDMR